jgi:arylsulfatase A-like enzyme
MCVGGVGFFNLQTDLGRVLPGYFTEHFWEPRFGVTDRDSTRHQFEFAAKWIGKLAADELALLFVNVAAMHQPNYFYTRESGPDDLESHAAALRYVDSQLPVLLKALAGRKRRTFFIVTSDHGTAYGEEGWTGHRLAHPAVWTVPYAEGVLS